MATLPQRWGEQERKGKTMIQNIFYQEKGLVNKDLDLQRLLDSHVADSFFKFVRIGNPTSNVSHEDIYRMLAPTTFSNSIFVNSKNLEYAETVSLRDVARDIERLHKQEEILTPLGLHLSWGVSKDALEHFKDGFEKACELCEFLVQLRVYRIGDKSYYFITRESIVNVDHNLGQLG